MIYGKFLAYLDIINQNLTVKVFINYIFTIVESIKSIILLARFIDKLYIGDINILLYDILSL